MSKIEDGGPAYPGWTQNHYTDQRPVGGMNLRDYFAAKAMTRIVSYDKEGVMSPETLASASYRLADAMLKAREKS